MSKRETSEARECRIAERDAADAKARLDGPVSRRELLAAIEEMKGRSLNDAEYSAAIVLERLGELLA